MSDGQGYEQWTGHVLWELGKVRRTGKFMATGLQHKDEVLISLAKKGRWYEKEHGTLKARGR